MTTDATPEDAAALLRDLLKREPGVFTGAEENALRAILAEREQLHDEYGIRITYISTRTLEATVADTLDGARAELADLETEDRRDVVSRTLIQRVAGDWYDVEGSDRG